ncbi:MAG: hypothetical protein ACRD10_06940 [Terriglobia bacterium]
MVWRLGAQGKDGVQLLPDSGREMERIELIAQTPEFGDPAGIDPR